MNQKATLQTVPITKIYAHPDNPRVSIRGDVVAGIAANLASPFTAIHAIHVRPHASGFQIVSGHHRVEAARVKGITELPAWVEDLDDEQTFMALVLSNNQGELSPLEIGMHALKAVPKEQGKKGGGLAAYAATLGKSKQTVGECRMAAEVAATCTVDRTRLLDRCTHLATIHAAPEPLWPLCVDLMLSRQ